VVAIDIGRLADTANEVQNVADIAALSGAVSLLKGGSASVARTDAQTAAAQNSVAGSGATIQAADVHVGQYNVQTNTFIDGVPPPAANAVKTTPSATVRNLFAGYFGASFLNTTINKTALAGFSGLGQVCGANESCPNFPIVIGSCSFNQACFGDPSCLITGGTLTFTTTSNNGGWTSFQDSPAQKNTIEPYFPPCGNGTNNTPSVITVGDTSVNTVNLINGNSTPLFKDVQNCFSQGTWHLSTQPNPTKFLVPIVSTCSQFNQTATVVGFATIEVSAVTDHSITVGAIFTDQISGPPGGGAFGTGTMRLFN